MKDRKFQAIMLDITNNCNIRCTFCINEWDKAEKNFYMDSKTFDKVMELLPLVKRGFLSCAFEPTIHPNYIDFFKRVPKNTGAYTFITTNLAKKFKQKELEELSNMNLNSITISLTSLNAELYNKFHVGAKFNIFIDNLERLVTIFKQKPDAPELRYITIVFKQNLEELEYIAETCHKKYLSVMHQFRTVFRTTLKSRTKEWADTTIPSREEWENVSSKLAELPYVTFFNPLYPSYSPKNVDRKTNTYITIRSDGRIIFHETDKKRLPIKFREEFNINNISKPYKFFKTGLNAIKTIEVGRQSDSFS